MKKFTIFLLILITLSFSINILKPINDKIIDGKRYYLGKIGIGQAFEVVIEREETKGGIFGEGGYYDYAYAFQLPQGWNSIPSALYGNPLQVIIKSPENAEEGTYVIGIAVVDENNAEGLGTKRFFIEIEVVENIMDAQLLTKSQKGGISQPIQYSVSVTNKADIGDIFVVEGISHNNYFYREVYIPPHSTQEIIIEFSYPDEGTYEGEINVYMKESPNRIRKSFKVTSIVHSSLIHDFQSLPKGFPLFYVINLLSYYIISFISSFLFS